MKIWKNLNFPLKVVKDPNFSKENEENFNIPIKFNKKDSEFFKKKFKLL